MAQPVVSGPEELIVSRHARSMADRSRAEQLVWRTGRQPHHDAYTPRALRYLVLLAALWLVNLMDAFSTLHGVAAAGWDAEANLLLRFVATHGGVPLFLLYKLGLITAVAAAFWFFHRALSRAGARARSTRAARHLGGWLVAVETATLALALLFAGAVWNNLRFAGVL